MRSYNLLFRTTFFTHRKTAGLGERRVCLRHIGMRKSNSNQIHADILQLQMHIYKWRGGAQLFRLMLYYGDNLNITHIVCTHVRIFHTKILEI